MDFPADPPLQDRVATGLAQLGLALRHRSRRDASARGLTPTQGQVLAFLRHHAGARLSALAAELAVTPATASGVVEALVEKDLVRRERSAEDGRALVLRLTRRGRAEADRAGHWPRFLRDAVLELPSDEQRVLLRAVVSMIRTLQRQGEISVARLCVTCRYFRPHAHADPDRPHHCALVDAPFGEGQWRTDCPEHEPLEAAEADLVWSSLTGAGASLSHPDSEEISS